MPTIVQTVNGKVTGLWGSALRRTPSGKLVALNMGDIVNRGDVILTTQDGIVQLTPDHDTPRTAVAPATDLDRVIAELNEPDALSAPAAGLNPGDGSGLQPGLRVGRISEDISSTSFTQNNDNTAARFVEPRATPPEDGQAAAAAPTAPGPLNERPTASTAASSGNEDNTLPISLTGQDTDGSVTAINVTSIPTGSALLLADGVTPVVAGQTLTPAQAAGLLWRPAPDFNGGAAVTFTVTDNQGAVSAPATVQISVLSVNDTPLANAGIASVGPEYSSIPVNLTGTDMDGTVASISVTTLPPGGALYLADGVTPVVPGTTLTPTQASQLVFVPNPGNTGTGTIGFTVTDNEGATSTPNAAQVNVTPVPTTVTLAASATTVTEGGSVVYSASVDHPVSGSPLVITLSNGSTITIPAGQSSGNTTPVVTRADDYHAQGSQTQTLAVAGTTGGNFSSLVTGSTIATTVTDDADASTVSLSASTASLAEGGSVVYTASVNNTVTGSPLVVTLSNGQTITIPVGQSSGNSAPVVLRPDDANLQGLQTISTAITGTSGGNFEAVNNGPAVNTTVTDDADASTVTLSTSTPTVAEGGSVVYTASLSSPVAGAPLVITLINGQTITIPVGQSSGSSAPFAVRPDDAAVQGTDTLTVNISGTAGGSFEALTPTGTATTTVTDDTDTSTVTLSASAASVTEGGSITYTASVSSPVAGVPLVVTLSNGQQITIPVGQSSASSAPFAVRADDVQLQGSDTLSVNISATTGGNYEALTATGTATTTVGDDADATTATLTASTASVIEGGSIVYTATLNNAVAGSSLVITLSNGQTITIPVGQSSGISAPFAVRADDALAQGTDTLNVNITTTAGGSFEAVTPTGTATTTVSDNADGTTVTLTASATNVSEGGSLVYTATLSAAVSGAPLLITLSNGQVISIPVGQSSGSSAPFAVRADDAHVQPDDTLVVTIANTSGGDFEALTPTGTAATTVSDDADVSTVTLSSSATSVSEGGSVVYTATLSNPVVGTPLVISLNNGQSIVIPVGQSAADSAPFAVRADDNFVQGAQSFSVSIAGTSGGSYESLATSSTVSTTVNDDADTSTVSLSASPAVAEGGSIVYTATLTSAAQTAVVVTLSNGSFINIAAGASSGTVTVAAPSDDVLVDAGSVSATIASATGGNFESLLVDPSAASTSITDTLDTTTLSLTGSASVSEAGSANYTLSLTSVAQTAVTVTLTYSGNAANGSDFTGTTTVTIPAGASLASFSVAAIDDVLAEGPENFTVAITSVTGGNFESLVVSGGAGSVSTGIVDNDISTVSLAATPSLSEAGGNIVYTATLTQAPATALTVTLSNGAVINVAAGAFTGSVSVPVAANEDVYVDPSSLSATIASTSGGGIPLAVDPAPAVTAITDTVDTTTLSLNATASVAEGGSIVYTASLSSPAGTAVNITLSNGASLSIAAGASSGSVAVAAPGDDVYVDAGAVSATITAASGGNFESLVVNPAPALTSVTDTIATTTVSLTATATVAEGGSIVYTASLNAPAQTAVTVNLSNGSFITIAAGASTGTVAVLAPADDVIVDAGSVSATITGATGGNFESLAVNPAAATTAVIDTLDTTTVSLTATPSVSEGGSIVYTASLTSPASTAVSVTLSNGASITILAGTSSGSVAVAAPGDDVLVDASAISATITAASGGNFENLVVNPAAATTSVTDTVDTTTVSLTASPSVAEGGNIVYTASLGSPAGTAVTVTLSNGAQITIAAGASSGSVPVAAPADDVLIDAGTVSASIVSASGGNFESLAVNPATATTSVTDTIDTTTVSLTASPAVAEGGSITYTASLTAPAGAAVTVALSNGATITILAGATTGNVSVAAPSDDNLIDAGTVSATIDSASGGNFENLAVDPSAATTSVSDTVDTTSLSLTASPSVAEGGNIVYTASLTSPAGTAMSVTLSNGATLTILAGASTGSVSVAAPSDDAIIDAGSVSATITAATGGNFENLAVNPSAATTSVSDTIDTTTVTLTATPAVAEGGSIVYTASLTAPADTAVTVRLSNGAQINIAAGASTSSVSVAAPSDDAIADAGTVSTTITSATGGNFENLAVNPSAATTSVSDTVDTTTVTLTATPSVTEGGSIVYTASLTSAAAAPVTVTLSNGAQIIILAGASVGTVSVPAPSEDVYLDAGNVSATIATATGGNFENLAVNPASASTAITDTIGTTTVSLTGAGSVAEGASASYTVSLTSLAQTAVTITLSYSGTATDGTDFSGVTTVTIPANSSSASFSIATLDDVLAEGSESFSVAIASATGGNFENLVVSGSNGAVTTGIVDNDISTVSLSATPSITEAGGGIVYTATVTQAPVSDLSVTLSNGAVITVTAGSLSGSVTVPVAANEDVYVDPSSVSASIASTSGGGIALSIDPTPATTAVTDTIDTTTVSLAATPAVAEGGSIVYTATLTSAAQTAVVVNLSNGQQINIAAGASSGTLTLAAPADDALVDSSTVSLSISSASGGNFESLVVNPSPAVTTVSDTVDTTTLTLTATPSVAEGGSIVYTASLSSAAGTAVTVTLSNGSQINIAAGASTGTVLVAAPADDALIDAGTVSATITGATGGNFENLAVNPSAATTLVTDTIDTTTVTLTATASVSEGGNIVYTASLNNAAGTAVTVTLSNGAQINIAAGASTGSVSVPAPADDGLVDAGPVSVTISGATGGNFENLAINPAAASTSVSDTVDSTTVSLTATPTVTEGGSIVYTASLTAAAGTAVTVTLSNGTQIVIAAGASTGSTTLPAPTDDVLVDAGSVSLSIASASGGNFESLLVNPAAATTSVTDTIDTTTVSLTATPSVAEGGSIVYTASLTSPAGTAVTVTLSNGAQINILAGASSGTVFVPAPSDDALIDAGPVSATIASASGGNFENLVLNPAAASTNVTDTLDTTTVSLSATPTVAEGGSIVYTATLTAAAGTAVTVALSNGAQITIAAGASTGTVTVPAPSDDVYIDAGSVSASITSASGGNFENLVVSPAAATTSVTDTVDTATVSLTATASVAEGGSIAYTASLTHLADTDVTVNLSNGAQIVIAAGTSTNTVSFPAPTDDALIDAGTVSATITSATGGNFENLVANPAPATTSITDTIDTTTVSLSATPAVAEGGSIVYTASLTSLAGSPVTVTLSNGAQIVIAAGSSSSTVTVAAPTDDVYVDAGPVSATISTATGGNFESLQVNPAAAATSVTDTLATTTLSITGAGSVAEGASASYTVSLTSPAQTDVTITLSYSGTAADGSDFSGVTTVTIPANSSSANFSIATLDDALAEGAENFTVAIASATGGNFENLVVSGSAGSVNTGIVDNDISTLSLSATPAITEAGGNIVYTATLTQAPVSAMTVTLANGAVINVAAGALTGTVTVPVAASDDVYVDPSSISTTILSVSGGGIAVSIDPAAASTAVNDTINTSTASLSATATVAEGGSIVYTANLTSAAQTAVVVMLSNGAQINIAAGASSGTVTVPAPTDDAIVDAGSVSATITSASGGNFENLVRDPAAAVTTVTDTIDTTTVSLTATGAVAEGGSIVYTASLGALAQTPVTVTLSNGAQITILAGASSGTVSVAAPTDDVLIDAGSVSATITTATGGGFEDLAINPAAATTTVSDTIDTTTVSLTATPAVAEGGSIVYTASLTSPAGTAVTVTLSNGAQINILAGDSSGTVSVLAPTDDAHLDAGPVSATITGATGGNFENLVVNAAAATTSVSDTIDTSSLSLSATPSVAEGGSIVYTASLTAPADTAVTVLLSNGAQITILAGDSTGTVSVLAPTDDVYVDAGTVSASITSASGGNFENLVVNAAPAVTSVTDTLATTTLSITGSGSVAEGASASYTVSLTSPAQTAVTITLSYSGTAANGSDFSGVTTVTIPVNGSSANFSIATLDDALAEGAESFTVAIASATGGNFENLVVRGGAGSVSTGIVDNDISTLSLTATPSLTEAGGTIVYTATLTQAAVSDLSVTLSNGSVITITAGNLTGNTTVPLVPQDDVYLDAGSVSATISSTSGGGIALSVNPAPATTTITDTLDATTLSLAGSANIVEGTSGSYAVTLTSVAQTDVTVNLSYSGTAADGSDYTGVATVTIPAGSNTASFNIASLDDALAESGENFTVTVTSATGGNFENLVVGAANSVTTTITDEAVPDTVLVSLSGPASVTEGAGTGNYTVSLGQAATTAVTVNLNYAGTATNGSDYTGVVSVTIPAGATSVTFNLATLDDVIADSGETLVVSLGAISGGGFEAIAANGAANSVTTVISDEATPDASTVSLSATTTVAEGGSIVYTATLDNPAATALTVTLSNTATITIAAGDTTGSVSVLAPTEDVYADAATVSATITGTTGGGFEQLNVNPAAATTNVTDTVDTTTLSLTGSASVVEGTSGSYTVSLTSLAQTDVTVNLSYSGTAANGVDYTGVATVTILAGSSSASFSIASLDDAIAETGENFTVTATSATGGNFESLVVGGANSVTTNITDEASPDTVLVSLSGPASVSEGATTGNYTVSLGQPTTAPLTVNLNYAGTAADGSDYTRVLSVTIPAGASSATFNLATLDDSLNEATETIVVSLGAISGGGFEAVAIDGAANSVTTSIVDNDALPTLSINDVSVNEAAGTATFTVSLSAASGQTVTVNYGSSDGSATAGSDYSAASGTLSFAPGTTTLTVTVPISNDTTTEASETFNVNLSSPVNAAVADGTGLGTIVDNDTPPTVDLDADNSSGATGSGYAVTFTEGTAGAGVAIADGDISLTDPDSSTLTGATITLTNRQAGDALNLGLNVPGITVNVVNNAGSVTITLSGSASLADYAQRIRNISFTNSSEDPSSTPRTITVQVTDGTSSSNLATTTVNVVPVNDAPVAANDAATTAEDTPVSGNVLTNDSDVDNSTLSVTQFVVSGTTYAAGSTATLAGVGTLVINSNGSYTFTPAANYNGTAPVATYTLSDGALTSTATLGITVTPVNDAPLGANDTATVAEDTVLTGNVLGNDSDVDTGASLSVTQFTVAGIATTFTPGQVAVIAGVGTLQIDAGGSYTFTPVAHYNGPVPVATYTLSDGSLSATATLSITVTPVNDAPVGANDSATVAEDTVLTGNVLANDSDVDTGTTLSVTQFSVAGVAGSFAAGQTASITGVGTLLIGSTGAYTFTPAANYNGAVPVATYTLSDGSLASSATLTITVTPVNDAPVGANDLASTAEDATLTGNVLSNDTDVDTGTNLSVTQFSVAGVAGSFTAGQTASIAGVGTLQINANGLYSFTPVANYNGAVPVATYTLSDGALTSTATLTISVTPVNDAPVGVNDSASTAEDTPVSGNVLTNDTDVDSASRTVTQFVVSGTTYAAGSTATLAGVGSLVINSTGAYTFTPAANYNGAVPVATYTLSDGSLTSTATLSITITPVNDAPVGVNDSASTAEDTPVSGNVLTNDTDIDGASRTVTQFTVNGSTVAAGTTAAIPGVGTLLINTDGSYTFTPAANYNGAVPVATYTLSDGSLTSSATLTITITPVNDAPVGANDTATVAEDTVLTGNVLGNDNDVDTGTTLSVTQFTVAGVAGIFTAGQTATIAGIGTLQIGSTGAYTFTPAANYNGAVPVATYTLSDGSLTSTATLSITVNPVNDAPVGVNDAATTAEDTPVSGNVLTNDTDVDSASRTVTQFVVSGTTYAAGSTATLAGVGTLVINSTGAYTFTPAANYNGPVPVATYTLSDGSLTSTATLSINVTPVNDAPVGVNDLASTAEDATLTGNVLSNDTDVDTGTTLSVTQFTVAGIAGTFTAGQTASIAGVGTLLIGSTGSYTFTPVANYNGAVPIATYTLSDGSLTSTATLGITVTPVNDAPVGANDSATTPEDSALSGNLLGNDSDVDTGTTLSVTQFVVGGTTYAAGSTATLAGVGTLVINSSGVYTFTPVANYNGAVPTATYTLSDGTLTSTATLAITVTPVNDAPVGASDTATTAEDTVLSGNVLANDSDVDVGTSLTVTQFSIAGVAGSFTAGQTATITGVGTLQIGSTGAYTFTPAANYNGAVPVATYTLSDGSLTSTATLSVTVTPVNDAPVGVNDSATTAEDTPISGNVLTNDTDVDSASRTVTQFTVNGSTVSAGTTAAIPGVGTLLINADGSYTFTPAANYNGAVPVATYTLSDGSLTSTATLSITVTPVNDAPVGVNDTATTAEDTVSTGNVLSNDTDVDTGTTLSVTQFTVAGIAGSFTAGQTASIAGVGTLLIGSTGAYTFTPVANYNGPVPVATYTLSDGSLTSTATLGITVTPVNDAPVGVNDIATVAEDTVLTGNVLTNDTDADTGTTLSVTQFTVAGVAGSFTAGQTASIAGVGTLLIGSTGAYTFTPAANYNGPVPVATYTLSDGSLTSTATLGITVTAVNDAPAGTNDTATTAEDTPVSGNVLTNDTDVDSASRTVAQFVVGGTTYAAGTTAAIPGVGTLLINADGSYTFTPAANYNGAVPTATYTLSDGSLTSTATLDITVTAVNDAPVGVNDAATTNEDTAVSGNVLTNDTDVDSASRTVTQFVVNGTTYVAGATATLAGVGTLVINSTGAYTFTPAANYNGPVPMATYTLTDGALTSTATLGISVTAVNDAPVNTVPAAQVTNEDTPRAITGLSMADVDAASGSMTVVLNVTNGSLTVTGGTAGIANSGTSTVTLTGTLAQINATLAANVTYVPTANFNGAATLTMSTSDGGNTGTGGTLTDVDTVAITVNAVNDAPVATGSNVSGTEDTAVVFTWAQFGVTDIDTAAASLGIRVATLPADGTLQTFNGTTWVNATTGSVISKATIDAGSFRFVPDANESGIDAYGGAGVGNRQADYARFTFTPNDGVTDGAAATVRIDITPVTDAPTLTHNVSSQVTGVLSTLTSVGLTRDYFDNIATLASGASSTNPNVGEVGIETAVPTSSALISNIGVAGNLTGDTGVQVTDDDAYRVQGLIYLEAGRSYTFSGYADDTVRLEVGGTTLLSGQWGGSGQAGMGTFTSSTLTPTVTGYYSLEFMIYNTSGPGSYDLNLSVDGATAVDVSTANFQLFQSITQVDAAGGQRSDFVPNAGTGEGGYYSVVYNSSVQSRVYLAPVLASLNDTDGSESLSVQMQGIPVGAVLSDGSNTFTAAAGSTSVNITTWNRAQLSLTLPGGFVGTASMTAVATSTEVTTGTTAVTSVNVPVTVEAANLGIPLDEIATFNADALIGQAGADVYSVSQVGSGLDVAVSQGVAGSIPAQTGTETTGTIQQAFNTGAGNDYVQSGAGNDTIYLGDSGTATHPVSGATATQANVSAAQIMNLADDTTLTSATTGLLTNEADDTTATNNAAGNTSITTWSDVANGGSGNDVIYGQNGTDFIYGGTGDDYLNGGAGIDGVRGGAGNDILVGGAGNDVLRGDAGADVFRWELADRGAVGTPASDIVTDFNNATPAAGGDVLDLRDLLQGEASVSGNAGNLANYLHFTVSGGNTTIQISSSGAYSGGFNAGATDQSITLQGVDLTAAGTFSTDQQVIQDLLSKSKLIVDGS